MVLRSTRRRRARRKAEGKPAIAPWHRALRGGILAIFLIAVTVAVPAGTLEALNYFGISIYPGQVSPASEQQFASNGKDQVDVELVALPDGETPASNLAKTVFNAVPAGWKLSGSVQNSVDRPLANLCGVSAASPPVESRRATFRNGKTDDTVSVTVQTYGAGLAAQQFSGEKYGITYRCGDSDTRVSPSYDAVPVNTDSFAATVSPSGGKPYTVGAWIRGDVIVYVTASSMQAAAPVITAMDAAVKRTVDGFCASLSYPVGDYSRNPWSDSYKPLTERVTIEVPIQVSEVGDVQRIPEDLPVPEVTAVTLPTRPADPVWPDALPKPVKMPKTLYVPTSEPPTKAVVVRDIPDAVGPGCGWSFTGQSAPPFDQAKADEVFAERSAQASEAVIARQAEWVTDVNKFWKRYQSYLTNANKYNAYAEEVNTISAAWSKIQADRDVYNTAYNAYVQSIADRKAFIVERRAAQAQYNADLTACATAPTATPTPTPTPSGVPDPSASPMLGPDGVTLITPTPSAEPVQVQVPTIVCPPVYPEILAESVPQILPKPTPPADPRPLSEQPKKPAGIGSDPSGGVDAFLND